MSRNERRLVTKKAVAQDAATSFEDLRKNAEKSRDGSPVLAIIEGWKVTYSVSPVHGLHHLAASKVSPSASDETLRKALYALDMPANRDDCSWYESANGVHHWSWGGVKNTTRAAPPAYEIEVHADPGEVTEHWAAIAFAAANAAAEMADKLGVSTSGAHFAVTTPTGAKTCIHMTRKGEPKTPAHTVH